MAKVTPHPITDPLRGMLGSVVFRHVNGQLIASYRPRPTQNPPTERALDRIAKFKRASAYAKSAMADPELAAVYRPIAHTRGQTGYATALGDYYSQPTVTAIVLEAYRGKIGDAIAVEAHEDVAIKSVHVEVRAADRTVIESGDAAATASGWRYAATQALPAGTGVSVQATACDYAGNCASKTVPFGPL